MSTGISIGDYFLHSLVKVIDQLEAELHRVQVQSQGLARFVLAIHHILGLGQEQLKVLSWRPCCMVLLVVVIRAGSLLLGHWES